MNVTIVFEAANSPSVEFENVDFSVAIDFSSGFQQTPVHKDDLLPQDRILITDASGRSYYISASDFIDIIGGQTNAGASAYEIYTQTTTDNPVLSESDWIKSLYGHDGSIVTIGSNGNWWIDGSDTGVKAVSDTPKKPLWDVPVGSAIPYFGSLEDLHSDFHVADGSFVEGYGYVRDLRGKSIFGVDPYDPDFETVGKTGGLKLVQLLLSQIPKHRHKTVSNDTSGNTYLNTLVSLFRKWTSSHRNANQDYDDVGSTVEPTLGPTSESGGDEAHENLPPYMSAYWVIRVKETATNGTSGIESIVAGSNVTVDPTDPKNPVINVPITNGNDGLSAYEIALANGFVGTEVQWLASLQGTNGSSTETAPYVLSGLDTDIKTGVIVSHTILEKHQFTASDIYEEATTAPTTLGIVVDVLKNGVSIFSTKPTIAPGTLHSLGTHVLVTSPTIFDVGDIRSVSVIQIGTGETGKNLKLSILMHKTT